MMAVFRKAFRDSRWTVLWMSIGLALYALMVMSFYPSIIEQQEDFDKLLENYPKELMSFMYGTDEFEEMSVADPGVYLNSQFNLWVILILGAMVMIQAFNAITNAERNGTMDILMSFPISRREMLVARFANTVVSLLLVLTACFLTFVASTEIWPEFDVSTGRLAAAMYGMFFILLVHTSFTYLLVSVIPSSKRWAGAIAYTLFFGGYLIYSLSGLNDTLKDIRPFFLFDYYNATSIVNDGMNWSDVGLMLLLAAILGGLAWWSIDKKELGV